MSKEFFNVPEVMGCLLPLVATKEKRTSAEKRLIEVSFLVVKSTLLSNPNKEINPYIFQNIIFITAVSLIFKIKNNLNIIRKSLGHANAIIYAFTSSVRRCPVDR